MTLEPCDRWTGIAIVKVLSRMDANDHFVIFGEEVQGNMSEDAPIAVNHRKSAGESAAC